MNSSHQNYSNKKSSILSGIKTPLMNSLQMVKYNLKIIFGNKFLYFLFSAVVITLIIILINLFNGNGIAEKGVYSTLLLAGVLLIFYPTAFGIQSDKDGRTLEIIFGIPDYRYRVWFMRMMLIYAITLIILAVIAWLLKFTFINFSIFKMIISVFYPLAFIGFLTFFFSTLFRSGNATAAVIIILGIFLLILSNDISNKYWNIFFNPYNNPSNISNMVWQSLIAKNHTFLGSGAIVFLLGGLMKLQNREKFLG